jgi:chaperonin cofactor prefoldin
LIATKIDLLEKKFEKSKNKVEELKQTIKDKNYGSLN